MDSDPTHPLQCIFSSTKQTRPQKQVKMHRMKQSVAVAPILLNPKFKGLKETDNISPIEALCNSPAVSKIIIHVAVAMAWTVKDIVTI